MPQGFEFPDRDSAIWVPLAFAEEEATNHNRHFLQVVGRLNPGVTLTQANGDLAAISMNLAEKYPASNKHIGAFAVPLRQDRVGNLRLAVYVLIGAVGFVLLIACANVANLLLARGAGRYRELALRMSLGARRGHIVRQLLTESVFLAVSAGLLGLILSISATGFLNRLIPTGIPYDVTARIDTRIFAFTLLVSTATGLLFGVLPALRLSRINLNDALKQAGSRGGVGEHGGYTRDMLVITEVALAMILLTGAGLMIETFAKLRSLNPGFSANHVLVLRTPLPDPKYPKLAQRTQFYDQVLERVSRLPGVVSAGYTTWLPLTNRGGSSGFTIEGRPEPKPGEFSDANLRVISRDYIPAMSMTLKAGSLFTGHERQDSPLTLLVNETMARQFWPGENPTWPTESNSEATPSDEPWRDSCRHRG